MSWRLRDERGQAMVEFALVMPLLLILVIGIIEFGRAWNISQAITDAAREGARTAVIFDETITEDSIRNVVRNRLRASAIDPSRATITTDGWNAGSGQPATIGVSVPYQFVFFGPVMGWTTGKSSITLATSFTMRNE